MFRHEISESGEFEHQEDTEHAESPGNEDKSISQKRFVAMLLLLLIY